MSFFVLTSYLTALASIVFGAFVYFKNRKGIVNITFLLLAFMVALWGIGIANEVTSSNSKIALMWLRTFHVGVCLIPIAFFHFSMGVIDIASQNRRLIVSGYLFSAIFIILIPSRMFIEGVHQVIQFPYYLKPGPFYHLFMLYFVGYPAIAEWKLFQAVRILKGNKSKQAMYVFIAGLIGFLGGLTSYLPAYDIKIYPLMNGFVFLYVFILAISVLRHNLMDIEVIIRKTLVFAGLFSAAFGIFAFIAFLTQELLSTYVTGRAGRILSLGISVFLIVLVYEPLKNFLINLTDRFLFQKQYDYKKLLRDASAGISRIKSLNQLSSLVVHFMTMRFRVHNAAVLIRGEKKTSFHLAAERGYEEGVRGQGSGIGEEGKGEGGEGKGEWENGGRGARENIEQVPPPLSSPARGEEVGAIHESPLLHSYKLDEKDQLLQYMAREHVAVDIERVKELIEAQKARAKKKPKNGRTKPERYDFESVKARMDELHAACCVPSFLGNELRSVLVLGDKKSGDYYSDGDLDVLYTLAQESAIAVENARLYDQAVQKAKELQQINKELEAAQTNLLQALSDTEIANKRLRDAQMQLIHEQKMATLGRLASSVGHEVNNPLTILSMNVSRAILKYRRDPDLKVSDILDVFEKMEQNIGRIKAVVNTLTGLLKKSERGKFEPLSLKLVLEETLPLVQFQTYLENLSGTEVEFDIPGNTPLIKGDLERLQEVFLNLFINAYHAMAGKTERKIMVKAYPNPADANMVMIEFSDTGSGIPDDVMKKIFNYGFTTKPPGKGSGIGLYMCRYIVELHGGEVKVRSQLGAGTTFIITLPIHREETTAGSAIKGLP